MEFAKSSLLPKGIMNALHVTIGTVHLQGDESVGNFFFQFKEQMLQEKK